MNNKKPISVEYFIGHVDLSPILDEDETPEDFINTAMISDPDTGTYESNWGNQKCLFFQTAGFEFIFV